MGAQEFNSARRAQTRGVSSCLKQGCCYALYVCQNRAVRGLRPAPPMRTDSGFVGRTFGRRLRPPREQPQNQDTAEDDTACNGAKER